MIEYSTDPRREAVALLAQTFAVPETTACWWLWLKALAELGVFVDDRDPRPVDDVAFG